MTLKEAAEQAQIELVKKVLSECGNIENSAVKLGVAPSTLYRKLREWNLYGDRRLKIDTLIFKIDNTVPK